MSSPTRLPIAEGTLTAQPLTAVPQFNWVFLIELIVCGILTLFFLFYFNRVFATLLSYGIRAYTWHFYRIHIDIHALQISLLGGRIFFKGIRYHGENETILIHSGYITWRYWLRLVRTIELDDGDVNTAHHGPSRDSSSSQQERKKPLEAGQGENEKTKTKDLPCRIKVTLHGVEWFVYNRSAAYDTILSGFRAPEGSSVQAEQKKPAPPPQESDSPAANEQVKADTENQPSVALKPLGQKESSRSDLGPVNHTDSETKLPTFLAMLPIWITCHKGALVMGNEHVKTLLTTTFEKGSGRIDAGRSSSLDLYKQIFEFELLHPVVQFKPNPDFKHSQMAAAKYSGPEDDIPQHKRRLHQLRSAFQHRRQNIWNGLRDLVPYFQKSVESFQVHQKNPGQSKSMRLSTALPREASWAGLTRYLDEENRDEHEGWSSVEYGRFSTILDCRSVVLKYFWDIPGKVSNKRVDPDSSVRKLSNDINGTEPPEWGMNLTVRGGALNYGPWADRQRVVLQSLLFPNTYRDSYPADALEPGQWRQSTSFILTVDFEDETNLRIPTRESSKDWIWKGRANATKGASNTQQHKEKHHPRGKDTEKGNQGPDIRPFGWLGFGIDAGSRLVYQMDMFATSTGYCNRLEFDLPASRVTSSVNHGVLWTSRHQKISCDLSNPLGWNSLHTWSFNIDSDKLELFILRDHIFLLTDLVTDWTSGPLPDFYTFVPFQYKFRLSFANVKLYLNVNDLNIINNPTDLDDNSFLIISSASLASNVLIPTIDFRPKRSAVSFDLKLSDATMDTSVPLWNTRRSFLEFPTLAVLDSLTLTGNYMFHSLSSPSLTDVLTLDLSGNSPKLYLYGFLINYFLKIKENYFGDDQHFKTLEEFQEIANSGTKSLSITTLSNDLDVMLTIHADNCKLLLPGNIHDRLNCVAINAATLDTDMRFTNYYMDLQASFSPLAASIQPFKSETSANDTELFLDGLTIYGHRLFGLAPSEPTYVCNWDFTAGRLMGECSPDFLRHFWSSLMSLVHSIDDEENSLPPPQPIALNDVTFLRAKVDSIELWILLDAAALLFGSGTLLLDYNDWAGIKFSEHLNLSLPDIRLAVVDRATLGRARERLHPVKTHALFQTSLNVKTVERKADFLVKRNLQQEHIKTHDQRTHRAPWLLLGNPSEPGSSANGQRQSTAAMPVPSMPAPICGDFRLAFDNASNRSPRFLQPPIPPIKERLSSLVFEDGYTNESEGFYPTSGRSTPHNVGLSPNASAARPTRPTSQLSLNSEPRNQNATELGRRLGTNRKGHFNSWSAPNFRFHQAVLDQSDLPSLPPLHEIEIESNGDDEPELSLVEQETDVAHSYLLFNLATGLSGFCHPQAIYSVSEFLESIQPLHPIEIIDDLQATVISDLLSHLKNISHPKRVMNMNLRIPSCRVSFMDGYMGDKGTIRSGDRFEFESTGIRMLLSAKTELKKETVKAKQTALTTHLAAGEVSLLALTKGTTDFEEHQIARMRTEGLVLWSSSEQAVRSRIRIEDFGLIIPSESIHYLPNFIQRSDRLLNSVLQSFEGISERQTRRLHSLVYTLTKAGSHTPDPPFLTRPSYVLRVADNHLRENDSWKILSRLRNIYQSLSDYEMEQLNLNCIKNSIDCPSDCESVVLSTFDQWRAWDLAHVKKSHVMQMIWGEGESKQSMRMKMDVSVFVRQLQMTMDQVHNASPILIDNLSTLIQMRPSLDTSRVTLIIQNYCSSIFVKLRWELIRLIEDNLDAFSNISLPTKGNQAASIGKGNSNQEIFDFHILAVADTASLFLDCINLRVALLGNAIKSSLCHQSGYNNQPNKSSVLVTSESASARVTSRAKELMLWKLFRASVTLSHAERSMAAETITDWKCSARCRSLKYDMAEDLLGLIHIVDRFVEDEVNIIMNMATSLAPTSTETKESRPSTHRFQITTFLDDYQLYLMSLPTITYVISGDVVRLSLSPVASNRLEVDFDIKSNTHTLQSNKDGRERVISSLTIPPINGRIVKSSLEGRAAFDVYATIELIKVDADSIRNILGAISGPEISHFVSELQGDIRAVKNSIDHIIPHAVDKDKPVIEQLGPLYKLRLTLAGINIHSSAPSLRSENSFADMDLGFGILQINLDNSEPAASKLPELDVSLSQMSFDLRKRERGTIKSVGSLALCAQLSGISKRSEGGQGIRHYHLSSKCFEIELSEETASMIVDIAAHLQERFRALDMSQELKHLRKLRRIKSRGKLPEAQVPEISVDGSSHSQALLDAVYSVDLSNIQVSWSVSAATESFRSREEEDLVFSVKKIELATERQSAARLRIEDMQIQMVPLTNDKQVRSQNSALLPEAIFDVAYLGGSERRLAFHAAGKVLDIRMTSDFIVPGSILQRSLASASVSLREAKSRWIPDQEKKPVGPSFTQLKSLLVDADFAGAVVSLQGRSSRSDRNIGTFSGSASSYHQNFSKDTSSVATLRAPGVAIKVQFEDNKQKDPTLNAEVKVAASTNVLHPTVVPLVSEITSSITEVVGESNQDSGAPQELKGSQAKSIGASDPTTILGRCKLNMGLKICKQQFTLTCQPFARVAATAHFEDSYITVNTVESAEQKRFFAILIAFNKFQAAIKHVYSSESTANFDIDSIVVSLMNSKHVSSSSGISAILKIYPTRLRINAKQVQDFLLFHEIWMPFDDGPSTLPKVNHPPPEGQPYIVQQYQQMASAEAFPWNSSISVEQLDVQLDLGQTLGKSEFTIKDLWLSSKKNSDWEQNLCVGFRTVSLQSVGRLSGFVELSHFKIRTSIEWLGAQSSEYHTPLIQAAIGFKQLQSKVSFEYHPFLVADVSSFEFFMYNVRDASNSHSDRLVSILEGDKFQVFCTTLTASQGLALFQAVQRLVQDKQSAFEASLREIEGFIRQRSKEKLSSPADQTRLATTAEPDEIKMPISLQTNVVVNLKEIKIGAFPNMFQDNQIFKLEALDAEARFSVAIEDSKIHSGLGLTVGQLRVALSTINRPSELILEDLPVDEIVSRATGSRGGTILKVPRLVATMETWQVPESNHIDYIFKSSFEGKVDVGWNYTRIAFIRGMWDTHSRALANRLGKPLPQTAVHITGGPEGEGGEYSGQEKITAVVNVPQSRYTYTALETPVIETPQLRDMGEATPPLEWIGLHRDKLPNVTHQIIIVTLMEVAKDVEDAYSKILGS